MLVNQAKFLFIMDTIKNKQVTQRNLFFGARNVNDFVIARITISAFPLEGFLLVPTTIYI